MQQQTQNCSVIRPPSGILPESSSKNIQQGVCSSHGNPCDTWKWWMRGVVGLSHYKHMHITYEWNNPRTIHWCIQKKWFMLSRNCAIRRLHAPSVTHLSTHLLTFFMSDIFPLQKVIILGVRRVKSDHVPPVTGKRLPAAMLGRNMCTDAAECSHAGAGGGWGADFILRRWSAKMFWGSCDHRRIRRHPTPFSQSRNLRLPDRADRHINDAESAKPLNSAWNSPLQNSIQTLLVKNNNEVAFQHLYPDR